MSSTLSASQEKKILIDILHPAHVHFFKNSIREWQKRGYLISVLSRDKDCAVELAAALDCPVTTASRHSGGAGLLPEYIVRFSRLCREIKRFKPDLLIGLMGVGIAPAGYLFGIPALVFYDTEIARLTNWLSFAMARRVLLPSCYKGKAGSNTVFHESYHELAYLSPRRFKPNPGIKTELGLDERSSFIILRFTAANSSHDLLQKGLSTAQKRELAAGLSRFATLFISSETPLPPELKRFAFPLPASRFHDALAFASLVVGESATVASEAAVLGTPAFYISDSFRGYTDELSERYGLVFKFCAHETAKAVEAAAEIIESQRVGSKFKELTARLISEKADMTDIILEQVEQSLSLQKKNSARL